MPPTSSQRRAIALPSPARWLGLSPRRRLFWRCLSAPVRQHSGAAVGPAPPAGPRYSRPFTTTINLPAVLVRAPPAPRGGVEEKAAEEASPLHSAAAARAGRQVIPRSTLLGSARRAAASLQWSARPAVADVRARRLVSRLRVRCRLGGRTPSERLETHGRAPDVRSSVA